MSAIPVPADALRGGATLPRLLVGLGGLYMAQSVVGSVVFIGLPAVLRQNGARLGEIAFILLTVVPWSLKFLWAPLVERYRVPRRGPRRSRSTVAFFGLFAIGAMIACALLGPTAIGPLTVAIVVASFASATVDIACDGHAVESLAPGERGWGNAVQVGGAYLGSAIGGGMFLVLVDHLGWRPSALVMAGVLVGLGLPFLLASDGVRAERPAHPPASLGLALRRPEIRSGLLLVAIYVLGQKWAMTLIGPFLVDAGLSLGTIGTINGLGITALGLAGAAGGGALVRRFGAVRVMRAALALQTLVMMGLASATVLRIGHPVPLAALVLASSASLSTGFVALYAELMGRASPDQAGVDFTLFQSMDSVVSLLGWQAAAMLGERIGYAACFAAAGLLGLVASAGLSCAMRGARGGG